MPKENHNRCGYCRSLCLNRKCTVLCPTNPSAWLAAQAHRDSVEVGIDATQDDNTPIDEHNYQ